jgi:hypothetical protein
MPVAANTVMTIRCSQFIADSRQLVHFIFHNRSTIPQCWQYEIIQGSPSSLQLLRRLVHEQGEPRRVY